MFKTYKELIEFAQTRVLDEDVYREKHHIIPRYKNGSDIEENLIELTLA